MGRITMGGKQIHTCGDLPKIGSQANNFTLTTMDLGNCSLDDFKESRIVMNVFPSIETAVCSASVKKFNELVKDFTNTKVICISKDLPFAQKRFCGIETIDSVITLSDFKNSDFGEKYGLTITSGPFSGLHSRCVIVLDKDHKIIYTEQVKEIGDEPNYQKVLDLLTV